MGWASRQPNFYPLLFRNRFGRAQLAHKSCAEKLCDRPCDVPAEEIFCSGSQISARLDTAFYECSDQPQERIMLRMPRRAGEEILNIEVGHMSARGRIGLMSHE